jgi:hypothetical protein
MPGTNILAITVGAFTISEMAAKGAAAPPPAPVDDSTEIKDLRKQVIHNANELMELITIEITVRSQMLSTEKKIQAFSPRSKEHSSDITRFQQLNEREKKKAQEAAGADSQLIPPKPPRRDPDAIRRLEDELKGLYEEQTRLRNSRRV